MFVFAPQVVGTAGQHRLGADGSLLDARSLVVFYGREQRVVVGHHYFEGVNFAVLVDRHHNGSRHCLTAPGNALSRRVRLSEQHLFAEGINLLILELISDLLPTKILPDAVAHHLKPIP